MKVCQVPAGNNWLQNNISAGFVDKSDHGQFPELSSKKKEG